MKNPDERKNKQTKGERKSRKKGERSSVLEVQYPSSKKYIGCTKIILLSSYKNILNLEYR